MAPRKVHHKFTRETVDKLMRGIRMGMPLNHACNYAGIDFSTFWRWREGKFPRSLTDDQKQLKNEFHDLLTRSEGEAMARAMSTIMSAMAQGNADIAIKFLERRYPEDFGMKRVEVTGKGGGPIQVESRIRRLLEEEAQALGIEVDNPAELEKEFLEYLESDGGDDE